MSGEHGKLAPSARVSMKIGELARLAGVTVRTLHHYDELGLLVPSERTQVGHRLYSAADVERLYRLLALREVGLPLEEIGPLLTARMGSPTPCAATWVGSSSSLARSRSCVSGSTAPRLL